MDYDIILKKKRTLGEKNQSFLHLSGSLLHKHVILFSLSPRFSTDGMSFLSHGSCCVNLFLQHRVAQDLLGVGLSDGWMRNRSEMYSCLHVQGLILVSFTTLKSAFLMLAKP